MVDDKFHIHIYELNSCCQIYSSIDIWNIAISAKTELFYLAIFVQTCALSFDMSFLGDVVSCKWCLECALWICKACVGTPAGTLPCEKDKNAQVVIFHVRSTNLEAFRTSMNVLSYSKPFTIVMNDPLTDLHAPCNISGVYCLQHVQPRNCPVQNLGIYEGHFESYK